MHTIEEVEQNTITKTCREESNQLKVLNLFQFILVNIRFYLSKAFVLTFHLEPQQIAKTMQIIMKHTQQFTKTKLLGVAIIN